MNREAMQPFGRALLAYFEGEHDAELTVLRDDGRDSVIPMSHFFRDQSFTRIDERAMDLCRDHVLDVGAGSGLHSLVLQERGLQVTAIDISPLAVGVMKRRGVLDVRCADIFDFGEGGYDTLLMMDHGIGVVENMKGLDAFLSPVHDLLLPGGRVILDSIDVRMTGHDDGNLSYQEANRRAGRYFGEIRMRLGFRGQTGPSCGFLHVDAHTLGERARLAGLDYEVVLQEDDGNYLAVLR